MVELTHGSAHGVRRPLRALVIGLLLCAGALGACGARSSVDLLGAGPVGGSGPKADPGQPSLPEGGGGASAIAGAHSVGGSSPIAGSPGRAGGGSGGTAPIIPACEAVTVAIDELRPALTLVIDQSLSMRYRYPTEDSPASRWSLVGDALFDPTFGVVKQFEATVRFGVAFFTSRPGSCPILNEVPAKIRNYDALNMLYRSLGPDGDTPTGDALQQVVTELQQTPSQGPRYILLVTDGNPDTCLQPNPDQGQPEAVAAAQRAFAAGIELYVLGISNGIAGVNLQQLANAGKGKPIDWVYGVDPGAAQPFQASDNVLELAEQFSDILRNIPLCEVQLQRDVTAAELNGAHVVLDGQPLPYSVADGYVLKDSRHLAIVGNACEAIKAGGRQLSVRISCD
ncbi:MAG TPA: vWA domain-containing protein [Polyangiaceae bacterium]|nr:vWA domain-containing protein [Polyangiaceae bacterium]